MCARRIFHYYRSKNEHINKFFPRRSIRSSCETVWNIIGLMEIDKATIFFHKKQNQDLISESPFVRIHFFSASLDGRKCFYFAITSWNYEFLDSRKPKVFSYRILPLIRPTSTCFTKKFGRIQWSSENSTGILVGMIFGYQLPKFFLIFWWNEHI